MNLLKALILTLAPAIFGMVCFYQSIVEFPLDSLSILVYKQLRWINCYWLLFSLILNLWVLSKFPPESEDEL